MEQYLENYLAEINANIFLKEFTFSRNNFSPTPDKELEFADHVIWLDDLLIIKQLKERNSPANPTLESEEKWFKRNILDRAVRQIKDTLRYLQEYKEIKIENQRGHVFDVKQLEHEKIIKLIVYFPGSLIPRHRWQQKHHISTEAGFIHLLPIQNYVGMCRILKTPAEIREYFEFRQNVILKNPDITQEISEQALVGQYMRYELNATPSASYETDLQLYFDADAIIKVDIFDFLRDFADHIYVNYDLSTEQIHTVNNSATMEYYNILKEFAKLNVSMVREINKRLELSIEDAQNDAITLPYRVISPTTYCGFVLIPVSIKHFEWRFRALQNITIAAKYDQKLENCVGLSIASKNKEIFIDWCLMSSPWEFDPILDKALKDNYPFGEVKPAFLPRFYFRKE